MQLWIFREPVKSLLKVRSLFDFARTRLLSRIWLTMMVVLLAIAVYPESPCKLLTFSNDWDTHGENNSKVPLLSIPEQFRHIRRSVLESPGGFIFRTWTHERGIVPLEVTSAPFRPTRYMSVAITGASRTIEGRVHAAIECESNEQRLEIFRGSVNADVTEAIVVAPDGWCSGNARLKFTSTEKSVNVGVGSVYEISRLSYLKSSFLGRLPFLIVSIIIFSLAMIAGASIVARFGKINELLPSALVSLGVASLGAFYLANSVPVNWRWIASTFMALVAVVTLHRVGHKARRQAIDALTPYARTWIIASLFYFGMLGLVTNGVGHWEPNYRFWPAVGASANALPWIFAEAIRRGWDLSSLFGGVPCPTDHPPLLAGAYLLLTDVFAWLQSGNDGLYLRGQAYNAAAVSLTSLWVPMCRWLLLTLRRQLERTEHTAIIVFLGFLPFVLFNTTCGAANTFSAVFALAAFGVAWQVRRQLKEESQQLAIVFFFVLGAFSLLSDVSSSFFLIPLSFLFLWWTVRHSPRTVLVGIMFAMTLLASWSLYQVLVLPSADPIIKYMLTGNYGYGHPDDTLWEMLLTRYSNLTTWQWLEIKKTMFLQPFLPLDHPVTQVPMNADFGANMLDKLRAWDVMMLSKGNLGVLLLVIVAGFGSISDLALGRLRQLQSYTPYLILLGLSLSAWLIMTLGLLTPVIISQWPQVALFGLALGGSAIVYGCYPSLFKITMLAAMTYSGMVWGILALLPALHIDYFAALFLLLLFFLVVASNKFMMRSFSLKINRTDTKVIGLTTILYALKSNEAVKRIGNANGWLVMQRALSILALLFSVFITIRYINQPLVDGNGFRQTQTAITSYWMLKEGWSFAYQTPVAGFPWSIPFEFPIYQTLVAVVSALTGFALDGVGRFISFIFLALCAWPAFKISRRLSLPTIVPWVFTALLWTSPLYVFWGRTFMIETMALFFAFASIPFSIDLIRRTGGMRSTIFFLIFATAGILQKATTGGPVLLFMLLVCISGSLRTKGINYLTIRRLIYTVTIFSIPIIIGLFWSHYTDIVKSNNPFGACLTSSALALWNFGSIGQKLSFESWRLLIWERSLFPNVGGLFGLLFLLLPWFTCNEYRRFAWLSVASLALFLLPMVIFTNLHVVHNYYQTGCVLFLIASLSIVIGGWLTKASGILALAPITTMVFIFLGITQFYSGYGIVVSRQLSEQDPISIQAYNVGRYLRENTHTNASLVIFGQGWSSEIAYQAQRKSMTVPTWFEEYKQVWSNPQAYLGDSRLGAIVVCPSEEGFPSKSDVDERLANESGWKYEKIMDCDILLATDVK